MVIRVGLVGLGREIPKAGVIGPGTWGVLAHLPSLQHLPGYHLVAVANSSIESARTAITNHKLPSEIKAYGSVSDLVKDPEVDLVVVSVRVGKHYEIAKPALLAKKNVYVEWPLAVTTSQAEELAGLARVNNLRTIVGVQARSDPLLAKVRELVSTGKIGNVVSSTVLGAFSSLPKGVGWPESAAYFLDIKSGGTAFHITFGHFLDSFIYVLGDFSSLSSIVKTVNQTIPLAGNNGKVLDLNYPKTSPDHILVQGILESGALASLTFRSPIPRTVDGTGWRWIITGSAGEIEITGPEASWQYGSAGTQLKYRIGGEDTIARDYPLPLDEIGPQINMVAFPGVNTAHLYETFAKGDKDRYATFEDALRTQRLLDRILVAAGGK